VNASVRRVPILGKESLDLPMAKECVVGRTGPVMWHRNRDKSRVSIMTTTVTDEQIRRLAETAQPYSLALLWWGPERHMDGAGAIELEHQRRMVSLRADGPLPSSVLSARRPWPPWQS
jgi:hypothetical protein